MGSEDLSKVTNMTISPIHLTLSEGSPCSRSMLLAYWESIYIANKSSTFVIPRRKVPSLIPRSTSPIQLILRRTKLLARLDVPSYPACRTLPTEPYYTPLLAQ